MEKLTLKEKSTQVEKKLVAFELPEELRQKVRKEAFDMGISFSAEIRLILSKYFENAKLNDIDNR